MKKIFVSGPYSADTKKQIAINVATAVMAGAKLAEAGYAPFVPHLSHYLHSLIPLPYESWIAIDLEFVLACDYMLMLPRYMTSPGSLRESNYAAAHGRTIYYSLQEAIDDVKSRS